VFPAVPGDLVSDRTARERHERGWRFLQANDLATADREFSAALKRDSRLFPSDAGLGYVSLARKDYKTALARFDLTLKQSPRYAPALVGRGDALLGLSRTADALQAFQAALAADPGLAVASQRVQVLQLRTLQSELAGARRALDAGRYDEARQAYNRAIAASPDSAFLYRDLGTVGRRQGEILESQGDYDGAVQSYAQAAAIEPDEAVSAALARARERASIARLPPEFAQIPTSDRLTRGDLAALIGVRFSKLLAARQGRDTPVITDTRGHWASPWILAVTRAGVMDVNANHTFQPRGAVRRVDLARIVSRVLDTAGVQTSAPAQLPRIVDVPPTNLNFSAVAKVVSSGIMPLFDDGTFRPLLISSGEEAVQVMERVGKLVLGDARR
jgi:tetratricopeptide (TPR) repeat protein